MKKTRHIGIVLLLASLCACFTTPKRLDNIPMMWKPTSELKLPPGTLTGISGTKVQFGTFKDVRKNPALVAENLEDKTPKPVTTSANIGDYVSANLREAFNRIGMTTVDNGGDVMITGEVRQFFVEETNTYKGTVRLHLTVANRAGKSLWTGSVTGAASRFGRSYSAENYYEVFSDSIISAVDTLVQEEEFRTALTGK